MPKTYARAEQVIAPGLRYEATISTDRGDIVIDLDPARAPKTVNNFVFLARDGFYDGLTFHRVVADFVIQAGCPQGTGSGHPGYRFDDEPVIGEYGPGAVAMANSGPNSNGSQFFICTVDDRRKLARSYNLFGQVTSGMDVVTSVCRGDVMRRVTVREQAASGPAA
jgi:cyclophilin family peptidyl-prolyl cis-trans isomerase